MFDDDVYKIYEDVKRWVAFSDKETGDTIWVYRRCPKCGRFITIGSVVALAFGVVELKGWKCKVHGEIQPHWDRGE